MTIFLLAVYENRIELVHRILKCACENVVKQKDVHGNSALHLAVLSNSPDLLSLLISKGLKIDDKNKVCYIMVCSWEKHP